MVMVTIHRMGKRSARPGTNFVLKVTRRTTSRTYVGLIPKKFSENTTNGVDESKTVFRKMCNISVACTVTSHETGQRAVVLEIHIFDNRYGWITRRLTPQSRVYLTARAHTEVYEELGYHLHTQTHQITIAVTLSICPSWDQNHPQAGFENSGPHSP